MNLHENKTLFQLAIRFTAQEMKIPDLYIEQENWEKELFAIYYLFCLSNVVKTYRLEKTEKKIKECIEHLEFFRKYFEIDDDFEIYFKEKNILRPYHRSQETLEFHLLFVIAELEINLCIKNFYNSKTDIEKKYCLKSGFLTVYEFFKSLDNKKNIIRKLCEDDFELSESYTDITTRLRNFKKEINLDSKIKEIRNKTSGHFHNNLKEFLGIIDSINPIEDVIILYELVILLTRFNDFLLKLTLRK